MQKDRDTEGLRVKRGSEHFLDGLLRNLQTAGQLHGIPPAIQLRPLLGRHGIEQLQRGL